MDKSTSNKRLNIALVNWATKKHLKSSLVSWNFLESFYKPKQHLNDTFNSQYLIIIFRLLKLYSWRNDKLHALFVLENAL